MTKEQKELLMKDLCARFPYKVKAKFPDEYDEYDDYVSSLEEIDIDGYCKDFEGVQYEISEIKPYLFPLSSMTIKQKSELSILVDNEEDIFKSFLIEVEFYNKHHIDYRGMIEQGLAIDATDLNIYIEEQQ